VDLLVVDPTHDADAVSGALLDEVLRSAANKGCSLVEAPRPVEPAELDRWSRHGFGIAGPRIERTVAARASRGR
jgi:hypothetical protein